MFAEVAESRSMAPETVLALTSPIGPSRETLAARAVTEMSVPSGHLTSRGSRASSGTLKTSLPSASASIAMVPEGAWVMVTSSRSSATTVTGALGEMTQRWEPGGKV